MELAHQKSPAILEHYNDLFEGAFRTFTPHRVLEIGISRGGSLALWESVFGCQVVGIDRSLTGLTPQCKSHYAEHSRVELREMTLPDKAAAFLGPFDLIIDDGGHGYPLVCSTLESLWSSLRSGGLYVIEDWRLGRLEPERLLRHLADWLIGNDLLEYAEGAVPAKMAVYRGLIAIEKVGNPCFDASMDPTL
jgi:SAM-dependent methyltransferase